MDITVELQPTLAFSWWWLLIGFLLLAVGIPSLVLVLKKRPKEEKGAEGQVPDESHASRIRAKYGKQLAELEEQVDKEQIDLRGAFQQMSQILRSFVSEMTGIRVQNLTLTDLKKVPHESLRGSGNKKTLVTLIESFYEPEFAISSKKGLKNTIAQTRRAIDKWI